MAERFEPIGVEMIAKGAGNFFKALRDAEQAVERFGKKVDSFAPATAQATSGTQKLGGAISSLLPSLQGATGGLGGVVGVLGPLAVGAGAAIGGLFLLKKGFDTLIGTVKAATSAITGFMTEGMQTAGTFQEMELAALAIGRAMGHQEGEIRSAIDAVEDAGIRYDVAARSVALLARNQIDLASAQELANRAQGAGILFGRGSTEAMEDLTTAIATGSTVRLRTLGVTEDMSVFEERYAKSIGKTVEQLTQQEEMTARVEGVLESLSSTMDVYDAVMESPTKRLRSLGERELPTLQAALSGPFLNAWATVIGTSDTGIRGFVNALTDAAREGGSLYPLLVKLGAVASILADGFSAALGVVTDFITNLQIDLSTGMGETVSGMLQWGIEIVASLAEGIITGASTVLVAAMNAISGMLTFWLGAASAPKVAPGLIKWGVAAMSEYLHGFTLADFSVLEKIQAPLKQILTGPQFAKISADMIKAISEGAVGEPLFERIAQAAGAFGTEIAELARLQFQLADATRAVEEAEKGVIEGRQQVTDLTAEYNKLVRAGAAPDVLKAKLAEINAAEEGLELAKEQRKEAKGQIGDLEDRAKLQDKVVGQLIGMAKAAVPPTVAGAAAAAARMKAPKAAKPEAIVPEFIKPTPADFDIKSALSEAIKQAKESMKTELVGIFKPLTDAWEDMKMGPLSEIVPAFSKMWGLVQQTWDDFWSGFSLGWGDMDIVFQEFLTEVKPALDEAWRALGDLWAEIAEVLGLDETNWGNLVAKLGEFAGSSTAKFITDFLDATVKGLEDFAEAVDWVTGRIGALRGAFDNLQTALETFSLGQILELAAIDLGIFQPGSITPFEEGLWGVVGALGEVTTTAAEFVSMTVAKFVEMRDRIIQLVRELTETVIRLFRRMRDMVVRAVREMIARVLAALEKFYKTLKEDILIKIAEVFEEMANRIVEAMIKINREIDRLNVALDNLIEKARQAKEAMQDAGLMGKSPSRFELSLRGAAAAMRQLSAVEAPRFSAAMTRVSGPVPAYAPAMTVGGAVDKSVTMSVGPNYIGGEMDLRSFELRVEAAVGRAIGTRW